MNSKISSTIMGVNFFGDEKLIIKAWIFMHNLKKKDIKCASNNI